MNMVKHVLRNVTELDSVEGYVVRREASPAAYAVLERVRMERGR